MPSDKDVTRLLVTGIYTLTPTHVGSGQAAGAVDLPIARERHTGIPLLPATALKGVFRDLALNPNAGIRTNARAWEVQAVTESFGPPPPTGRDTENAQLSAGGLVFTDGRLLAFPVRSVTAPYYWVTCPLVVDRWNRDLRALGGSGALPVPAGGARCAGPAPGAKAPLVLEDRVFDPEAWEDPAVAAVAHSWARLVPAAEDLTRKAIEQRLVCVPDATFTDLVKRATTVSARVRLDDANKTVEQGALWYEETLPPDCLFATLITTRRERRHLDTFAGMIEGLTAAQIGGNETVGQGLCAFTVEGVR